MLNASKMLTKSLLKLQSNDITPEMISRDIDILQNETTKKSFIKVELYKIAGIDPEV